MVSHFASRADGFFEAEGGEGTFQLSWRRPSVFRTMGKFPAYDSKLRQTTYSPGARHWIEWRKVKSVVLVTGSHIDMEFRVNTEASNATRRYRAGIFEWTGMEFLRPAARPSMSELITLQLTGIEQPWPLMLPLAHELPHEQASLLEIGEFIARYDPT